MNDTIKAIYPMVLELASKIPNSEVWPKEDVYTKVLINTTLDQTITNFWLTYYDHIRVEWPTADGIYYHHKGMLTITANGIHYHRLQSNASLQILQSIDWSDPELLQKIKSILTKAAES